MPSPNLSRTIFQAPNGRPVYLNSNGSFVTQQLISVGASDVGVGKDTEHALIPTIFNGQKVSNDEAIKRIRKAGGIDPDTSRPVRVFGSIKDADAFASRESAAIGELVNAMIAMGRGN